MTEPTDKRQDDEMADGELLLRAQDGDMSAFETLVEQHRDGVYGLDLQITGSEIEAAEIAQQTFLSAYTDLKKFRNEADFGAALHRIAAKLALTRLQQRSIAFADSKGELRTPAFNERGSLAEYPETDWSRAANDDQLKPDLRRAIQEATEQMPQHHRQVLLFKDVAGLGYDEIARMNGDSIESVRRSLHQARLSLREAIDRFYRGN